MSDKLKLIVIGGPTAVGKTDVAIRLAEDLDGEIISADSRQIYREMNIGTAKPSPEQLGRVRHHFINHISIQDYYSAGRFETEVIRLLDDYRKKNVVMAGGSGLYIKAVCEGIDKMPDPDLQIRHQLQKRFLEKGLENLTEELRSVDPESWDSIDLNNPKRVIRALEVYRQTGIKYADLKTKGRKKRNFEVVKIGLDLPREILFDRINGRVDEMLRTGLLDEVESLRPWKELTALQTVGYTEFFACLDGKCTMEEAVRLCKRNTRRYAKRQLTWFRKDPGFHWFLPRDYPDIYDLVQRFIAGKDF